MSASLTELMTAATSDKGTGLHNYTDFYSILFEPMREKEFNLLEVGIGSIDFSYPCHMGWWRSVYRPGASLRGWRDYFPNARVYGCDIDKNVLFTEERIETFYLDQTDRESIKSQICDGDREYYVIIDDGLHVWAHNFALLQQAYHKLQPGGYYIIEDIQDFDSGDMQSDFVKQAVSRGDHISYVQIANPGNSLDNNVFMLRKKSVVQI